MKIYKVIASGLGTGFSPFAPGTAGSILGILLIYLFNYILIGLNVKLWTVHSLNLFAIIFVVAIGNYSIKKVHTFWEHDAPQIVIDEIAGVWIAIFAMPLKWEYYLFALVLFRLFDIFKPFYIRQIDKMKTNWSVMLDDVLAGIYSLIVIQILYHTEII